MRIAFVHPDLGIGGAERLVVDAAVGLQRLGHDVVIYTSYRDVGHCFDEVRDGTLDVRIRGNTIFPSSINGRFYILCAILRQLHLALSMLASQDHYDAVFIDQLSAAIPLFKIFLPSTGILFYCHFPDKLLSSRASLIKSLYRVPFDYVEGWTTGQADKILVNSKFTASIFRQAFPRIQSQPTVVYPCVDTANKPNAPLLSTSRKLVLSINRFERKKSLELAISAFARLSSHKEFETAVLVVAGGHDEKVPENVAYHSELQSLCTQLNLSHETRQAPFEPSFSIDSTTNVYFLLSIPAELKSSLLASATVLAYTPEHEHFGIVPLEASLAGIPVLAQNNGGPLETVEDGVTGLLRPGDVAIWSDALKELLFQTSRERRMEMGRKAREAVIGRFSQDTMSRRLEEEIHSLERKSSGYRYISLALIFMVLMLGIWWMTT